MTITTLITRPESAAVALADELRARWGCGAEIVISPVMRIEWEETPPKLSGIGALIFTSRNGVEGFARMSDRRDLPCYAVGTATAEAAQALGLTTVEAGGDAEALVAMILGDPPKAPCLHLRGEHAVGEVAQRLTAAGVETQEAVLYRQIAEPISTQAQACLDREAPVILPLYSPRSAALCFNELNANAPLIVVAISGKVAKTVPEGVAEAVIVAKTPDAQAMLMALDQAYDLAIRVESAKGAQ